MCLNVGIDNIQIISPPAHHIGTKLKDCQHISPFRNSAL